MKTFVLDTHALVWFLSRDERLSDTVAAIMRDPDVQLIVPAIVLAEIKHLGYKRRFDQTLDSVLAVLSDDPRCILQPIDLAVVRAAPASLEIHDSLIVGAALIQPNGVDGILTRDETIRMLGLVSTVW